MGTSRSRRIALAALVLPALVLAAVAAGSYRPFVDDGADAGGRDASTAFVDTLFTLAAVLLVALTCVLVWLTLQGSGRTKGPRDPGRFSPAAFAVYLAVITAAFLILRHGLEQPPPVPEGEGDADPVFPRGVVPEVPQRRGVPVRGPEFMWPLAGAVAALIVAATIAAVLVRRRRAAGEDGPSSEEIEVLQAALGEAIDDLRREPDPRRAVVAAYARMEQALAVFGLPRRASEAPYEYLRRVGRGLEAERSVSSLTELFEVANFSSHTIDEPMRERAIESLTAVRNEVRAAS